MVENDSWLNSCDTPPRIKFQNLRHVFREIEHHCDIAALTGERRSSATAKHRRAMITAKGNRGEDIVISLGKHDADRHLAIIGTVGRVKRSAAVIETDFAGDVAAQSRFQRVGISRRCALRHCELIKIAFWALGNVHRRTGSLRNSVPSWNKGEPEYSEDTKAHRGKPPRSASMSECFYPANREE